MTVSKPRLWAGAFTGFYKPGVEEVRSLDAVSRFLYSARSVILVISAQAAVIAGLLAANAGRFALARVHRRAGGLRRRPYDQQSQQRLFRLQARPTPPDSPRMRYTVHPLASGVLETRTLVTGLAILAAVGVAIAVAFIVERGWTAVGFTAAGVAL